ncbi:hypothetical protein AAGI31_000945 [Listeria monocytogenes]|nr:hypothetical protein [Listeria monocytogenes]EAE1904477.1 hypothetical protein [Listeria monocytogenes]EKF5403738.1 hypothetical protein [Listeria monocytogenes]EKF5422924.1 hypothetical protein [Listeria monocytogenes]HAA6224874.1 hypothetical protein [Listeria monocytogenes]
MRKGFLIVNLLLAFGFVLAACGNDDVKQKNTNETEDKTKNKSTGQKNFTVNKLKNDGGTQGLNLEVVVEDKITEEQSNIILKIVIAEYKNKDDALYVNMHYLEGAYPAILNARHSYNKNGVKITGLKEGKTEIEMNKNFNKDR